MSEEKKNRIMPRGGRKGGTLFPKVDLKQSIEYAKKLVSKTHTAPQPEDIVLVGVFNNKGGIGQVRVSALKQFALLEGDPKGYSASALAKSIVSAPEGELTPLLRDACLKPKLFKTIYETFVGDKVSKAKIRQQALNQEVHPDSSDECVEKFISSLVFAKLAEVEGDNVTILKNVDQTGFESTAAAEQITLEDENLRNEELSDNPGSASSEGFAQPMRGPSGVQITISLDSTMDTEKLEKQLKLLKRYGAL
jgi:hypothetical protein